MHDAGTEGLAVLLLCPGSLAPSRTTLRHARPLYFIRRRRRQGRDSSHDRSSESPLPPLRLERARLSGHPRPNDESEESKDATSQSGLNWRGSSPPSMRPTSYRLATGAEGAARGNIRGPQTTTAARTTHPCSDHGLHGRASSSWSSRWWTVSVLATGFQGAGRRAAVSRNAVAVVALLAAIQHAISAECLHGAAH